ncbi:hypothetical protein SUGI_0724000 [Cryptomeria japonica]|nr:hypothetical protein SUGI_0724000 [Cryptomeria japonica]
MALTLQKFLIIILSEILVAVLVALIFAFLFWQRRRLRPTQRCAASLDALRPQRWAQRFTHNQVKTATSNFRHKLGSGGFGTVFKGTLPDNGKAKNCSLNPQPKSQPVKKVWKEKTFRVVSKVGGNEKVDPKKFLPKDNEVVFEISKFSLVEGGSTLDSSIHPMEALSQEELDFLSFGFPSSGSKDCLSSRLNMGCYLEDRDILVASPHSKLLATDLLWVEELPPPHFDSLARRMVVSVRMESSKQFEKQFRAEINSVGIINHANLVRLRGFCAQGSRRLLVYDYMPNGSLNSFLFTNNSKHQSKILDWRTRFEIALGTARGLLYLHEQCSDRIIHGDIKPENILLDKDFTPKLGDFGLAKLVGRDFSKVVTATRGTRGYLAPEWLSGLPITPKVDVYSFGMTLLEIISGQRNLDLNVQESSRYYFPAWVKEQICERNMINIVDKRIASDADVEELRRSALVSLLCIQNDEKARPNMAQVVLMLQGKTEQA